MSSLYRTIISTSSLIAQSFQRHHLSHNQFQRHHLSHKRHNLNHTIISTSSLATCMNENCVCQVTVVRIVLNFYRNSGFPFCIFILLNFRPEFLILFVYSIRIHIFHLYLNFGQNGIPARIPDCGFRIAVGFSFPSDLYFPWYLYCVCAFKIPFRPEYNPSNCIHIPAGTYKPDNTNTCRKPEMFYLNYILK